jgi:DNA helicase-2/ATP-dependent DNA helicase PcrA
MSILDGLNPEQLAAVLHDSGPQLVVAGAGTGKTQVITRRIAHLIDGGKAKPAQILALTFTEKAAREMQERLYELIGWQSLQVPVLTFHAFGAELLGRFASHIGRSVRGGLINDTQKTLLLQQHFNRVTLQYYGPQDDLYEFIEGVVAYIGQLQNAGIGPAAYSEYVAELRSTPGDVHPSEIDEQADLARLYTLYEEIKVETGSYDYSDQLNLPLEILRQRPNLAERLGQEYRYVLVDEYQDTNAVQDALLRMFVGPKGNIFAVGDDDQAIYGFRGAEIGNILAFSERYALGTPVVLVQNYRSGQAVLDAAYRLIQHNNPHRLEERLKLDKRLIASHDESIVSYVPYATSADEQAGVLADIKRRLEAGEPASSIAVLAATHAPLKALAKAMYRQGLPYAISTSVSIFEQPELLALWYLLKWLLLDVSEEAIGHVVLGPFVGWTSDEYREILEASQTQLISVEEAIRVSASPHAVALSAHLDEWRGWAKELSVGSLSFRLIFDTGLAQRWQEKALTSNRMIRVFEDLHRLLEQMQDFETVALAGDLATYMAAFPKPPALEVSEPLGDAQGVQLLTVHASKGLEFETVYLTSVTQRGWSAGRGMGRTVPAQLSKAQDLPPDHEFRRLMYVAVTRAKRELIVSAPVATAAGTKQQVSPFITEMLAEGAIVSTPVATFGGNPKEDMLSKLQQFYPMSEHLDQGRLPFEDADGWLNLSVTALGGYDFCPFEFYIQHVLKISQPMGPQLGFGSVLHRVFEIYYKTKLAGAEPQLTELQLLLDESWSSRGYNDMAAAEADRAVAHATLLRFYEREQLQPRVILGSEVPIRFEVPEAKLRLRGKIDALFGRDDGYEIRDFKTGRTKTDAEKLSKAAKTNFQLRSYALACEKLRGQAPSAVVLDYVVTMVEGEAQYSAAILRNHRDKLVDMADKIRNREFAPNPSAMHVCAAIKYYGTGEQDELRELTNDSAEATGE